MSVSSLLMMVRGANLPPIIAWEVSNTLGSFSFSWSNLSIVCSGLLIFFQAKAEGHHQRVVITSNVCVLENFVFWQCSILIGSTSSLECTQSGCGVVHLGYARSSSGCFVVSKSVSQHMIVKSGKLKKTCVLSHLYPHCRRNHKCLASFHKHPFPLLHSNLLAQQECPSVSDQ